MSLFSLSLSLWLPKSSSLSQSSLLLLLLSFFSSFSQLSSSLSSRIFCDMSIILLKFVALRELFYS